MHYNANLTEIILKQAPCNRISSSEAVSSNQIIICSSFLGVHSILQANTKTNLIFALNGLLGYKTMKAD